MADALSREERVAAGLKKLKQFQQRANKKGVKKKSPEASKESSPIESTEDLKNKEASSYENIENKEFKENIPEQQETSVSSSANCIFKADQQNKNRPSSVSATSSSLLHTSASTSEASLLSAEGNKQNLEQITKSKSDLDIVSIKELSSTESLRQISQQINGLMSETHAFLNGEVEQEGSSVNESQTLERRNQELAALLDSHRQSNEQLQFQIQELKAKNGRLQRDFEREKQELCEKSHKEQVTLKDQLQVHIQTIGILVAEKTELQSSLSLSQQTAKQKAGEVEELQGRLRASRQRAIDLERELNSLTTSNQQLEKGNKESLKEIERLKLENYKLSKSSEELKQQSSELTEKLNKKISECQSLENTLTDTKSKLSIAELYVQQLSQAGGPENPSQVEELHLEKLQLEKKVSLHKESIDKLISERDQMSEQYQLYVQQLSQQVTSLRDELKHITEEKEICSKEKNALQEKLESLEQSHKCQNCMKQLEDKTYFVNGKPNAKPHNIENLILKDNPAELKQLIENLETQRNDLKKDLETQVSDNAQMSKLVEEQEVKITDLETSIQRLQEQEVDKSRLMDTMQSDKVAASRAIAQNRELKKQLEELQSGFVTMSNDKLELTEKLHAEHHITKELGERLSQQEEELQELRDQLSEKEQQLHHLEKTNTKGLYQQNQIADRMRHYEAQGQLAEMLQQELSQAQERINVLVNQNTELRMALAKQAEVTVSSSDNSKEDRDASKRNDLVASLSVSVRQLEMERDQLMRQLEEQKLHRSKIEAEMKKYQLSQAGDGIDDGSKGDHGIMKNAMYQLEERFKQTMNQIAELSDERQQLEHLVTQLQGETDTIGDYIALYQIQRGLMRKRAAEKDDYIAQLARDRESLKTKLGELQDLVIRLLEERKQYQIQGAGSLDGNPDSLMASNNSNKIHTQGPDVLPLMDGTVIPDVASHSDHVGDEANPSKKDNNTAKKIIDLLTEIGTSNLIEKPVTDNFHPCPVCSGRLLTV